MRVLAVVLIVVASLAPLASAQGQPDIVQEHWYHTYPTLTADVHDWMIDNPDIVEMESAGETVLGRDQWVVRISDWSVDNKSDGTPKEKVYIDV